MPCDLCTAFGKQLDDVLNVYHETVNAMRAEPTSKQEIAEKEGRCRSGRDALTSHKEICEESPQ